MGGVPIRIAQRQGMSPTVGWPDHCRLLPRGIGHLLPRPQRGPLRSGARQAGRPHHAGARLL